MRCAAREEEKAGYGMEHEIEHGKEHKTGHAGAYPHEHQELTRDQAMKWTAAMENDDGSTGPRWPMDQTTQIMASKGYSLSEPEFLAVMNMLCSDYGSVFKRYGVDRPELYAELAKAWIEDPDAVKHKTAAYLCHVVKH